jgi:biotin carboxyl carrier protein
MELEPPPVETVAICGALLKAHLAVNATTERLTKEFVGRNAAPPPDLLTSLVELKVDFIWNQTSFAFDIYRHSPDNFTVSSNGSLAQAKLQAMPGGSYVCTFGGVKHNFHFESEPGERTRVTLDGKVVVLEKEKDPSVLAAPYGGKLTRYLVDDGAHVSKGGDFCEVEVMKMLFNLKASEAGTISLLKPAGAILEAGDTIARLALDDAALVAKATPFGGDLGDFPPPLEMQSEAVAGAPAHVQLAHLEARVHNMLEGFVDNEDEVLQRLSYRRMQRPTAHTPLSLPACPQVLQRLSEMMQLPEVMRDEFDELMTGAGSKLPQAIRETLEALKPGSDSELVRPATPAPPCRPPLPFSALPPPPSSLHSLRISLHRSCPRRCTTAWGRRRPASAPPPSWAPSNGLSSRGAAAAPPSRRPSTRARRWPPRRCTPSRSSPPVCPTSRVRRRSPPAPSRCTLSASGTRAG